MKLIAIFLYLAPAIGMAQQEYESALFETETGGYIVFSNDSTSLIFHLDTAKIELLNSETSFFVEVGDRGQ